MGDLCVLDIISKRCKFANQGTSDVLLQEMDYFQNGVRSRYDMKTALVNLMHELKWERDNGAAVLMLWVS